MNCSDVRLELEAYLAGELTDQEAGEVRQHLECCGNCSHTAQSLEQLQDALKEVGTEPMPDRLRAVIMARCADDTANARSRFLGFGIRTLMGAGAVALVLAVICVIFLRQQPVSAAEVVSRMQSAATRYRSWHIVYKATQGPRGGRQVSYGYETWYRAPDAYKKIGTLPGQEITTTVHGPVSMRYFPKWKIALLWPTSEEERDKVVNMKIAVSLEPESALPKGLKNPHLDGTVSIQGRTCDVLEGTIISPCNRPASKVTYAVDRETGLVLRRRLESGQAAQVIDTVAWQLDKPVPESVFGTRVPSDVTVLKGNFPVSERYPGYLAPASQAKLHILGSMADVRSRSAHVDIDAIYAPTQLPSGYELNGAIPCAAADGHWRSVLLSYVNPTTGDAIVLVQSLDRSEQQGKEITSGGFSGRVWTGNVPYPYTVLAWNKYKLSFTLTASSLAESEAIQIAKSLELVTGGSSGEAGRAFVPVPKPQVTHRTGPVSSATTLEFYYLKEIWGSRNPQGKWLMKAQASSDGGGFRFSGPQGKMIFSKSQPKQVLDEVVRVKTNRPVLTNRDLLATATALPDTYREGEAIVSVELTPEGTKKLAAFARSHIGNCLAIFYRDKLVAAPEIRETIPNGKVQINMSDMREARSVVEAINSDHASK